MIIDCIIRALEDGKPHPISDVTLYLKVHKVKHTEHRVRFVLGFLETYAFITHRRNGNYVLTWPVFTFLQKLKEMEAFESAIIQ